MWFDTIVIDKVNLNGTLQTSHIRSKYDSTPVEKLEQIDIDFHSENSLDIGLLRVHATHEVNITDMTSKIKNIALNDDKTELYVQLDHFGIPVTAGYYACIFPKGWRLKEANVYDPYSDQDNPANNRSYRDVRYLWDKTSQLSAVQFEMLSNRGTFTLGVIARLASAYSNKIFIEEERNLSITFTDKRHRNHPLESPYDDASQQVINKRKSENKDEVPAVNIGLTGPTIDIIAWGKFIANKIRRPKR